MGTAGRPTFSGPRGVCGSTPRPTDRSRSGHAAQVRRGLHWREAFVRAAAHIHGAPFCTAARDAPDLRLRALRLDWRERLTTKCAEVGLAPSSAGLAGALGYEMRRICAYGAEAPARSGWGAGSAHKKRPHPPRCGGLRPLKRLGFRNYLPAASLATSSARLSSRF